MPPKKDGDAPKDVKKKVRKKNKSRKNKDDCPSRIRKTDRVVLNKQARNIIAKVYDFMKREALADYAEKLSNARWRTATAVGVSEKTVSRILKDRNKNKYSDDGSVGAGTGQIIHGKLEAAGDILHGAGELAHGDVPGAIHSFGAAVGDVVHGDVSGIATVASGIGDALGQFVGSEDHAPGAGFLDAGAIAAGQVAEGKLGAVHDASSGVGAAASGDFTGAESGFSHAAGSVVEGDTGAVGTLVGGL